MLGRIIIALAANATPTRAKRNFDRAQMASAAFMAFNHGLNDGQKFMGVFAMTLLAGGAITEFHISWWVIVVCASTMGIGTSFGGWRIIQTVGAKMTRLTSWQGFAATMAASSTIYVASSYGVPLSTTHTITSAVVGVGRQQTRIRRALGSSAPDHAGLGGDLSGLRRARLRRRNRRQPSVEMRDARSRRGR